MKCILPLDTPLTLAGPHGTSLVPSSSILALPIPPLHSGDIVAVTGPSPALAKS